MMDLEESAARLSGEKRLSRLKYPRLKTGTKSPFINRNCISLKFAFELFNNTEKQSALKNSHELHELHNRIIVSLWLFCFKFRILLIISVLEMQGEKQNE